MLLVTLTQMSTFRYAGKDRHDGSICWGIPTHTRLLCAASASMVLLNKATLSSFDFHAPIALLFFQCFVCVVLVQMCSLLGFIKLEPWYALQPLLHIQLAPPTQLAPALEIESS